MSDIQHKPLLRGLSVSSRHLPIHKGVYHFGEAEYGGLDGWCCGRTMILVNSHSLDRSAEYKSRKGSFENGVCQFEGYSHLLTEGGGGWVVI